MDLKQYKTMIKDKILEDVKKQSEKEHKLATGTYNNVHNAEQYKQVAHEIEKVTPVKKKTKQKVKKMNKNEEMEDISDANDEMEGGKIHFLKHMQKFGNSALNFGKKAGKAISNEVIKQGAQQVGKYAIEAGKDFLSAAPEIAETVGAESLEYAPLLLAAGVEKPMKVKRKRQLSEKEKRRHALVRKIMSEKSLSLPQASKYIKENNINY